MDRFVGACDEQPDTAPHQALVAVTFVLKPLQYANRIIIRRMVSNLCKQTKHEQA